MLRMSVLALAAAAALGTAALTPTAASADWHGWRHFDRGDRLEDRLERRDRFEDRFERRGECFGLRQVWTPWGLVWRRGWIC
jgi:hypothetical protein